jgi:hypothetical protein
VCFDVTLLFVLKVILCETRFAREPNPNCKLVLQNETRKLKEALLFAIVFAGQ